jgi:hypothetical protein
MTDERIIAYLLEELPDQELEQFENECFQEEEWPDHLKLVEEDLIDAYLRDDLVPPQRQRFEQNYLNTNARLERVAMLAALLRHIDETDAIAAPASVATLPPPSEPTWGERFRALLGGQSWKWQAAMALALIVVGAGGWWLYSRLGSHAPQTFATLTLKSSVNNRAEGAEAGRVKLPLEADALKIILTLPEGAIPSPRYRVELDNADGARKPLAIDRQDAQSVSVLMPSAHLTRGQYVLKLFALQADGVEQRLGGYYFNLE